LASKLIRSGARPRNRTMRTDGRRACHRAVTFGAIAREALKSRTHVDFLYAFSVLQSSSRFSD